MTMVRVALLLVLIIFIARAFWRLVDGLIAGMAGQPSSIASRPNWRRHCAFWNVPRPTTRTNAPRSLRATKMPFESWSIYRSLSIFNLHASNEREKSFLS